MNRDDILRFGVETNLFIYNGDDTSLTISLIPTEEKLLKFAALVAAAEREACIRIIEEHQIPVGNSPAGEMACELTYDALKEIRAAIRARGET